MAFWSLFLKFVSSCPVCCEKSHKDGVTIVPHDLICMIHGLVLTSHLQMSCLRPVAVLNSCPSWLRSHNSSPFPSASWILEDCEICFLMDGCRTNWPYLSVRTKVWESWFTGIWCPWPWD
jgi:hypothetical protein